jgi:hypothetical protein
LHYVQLFALQESLYALTACGAGVIIAHLGIEFMTGLAGGDCWDNLKVEPAILCRYVIFAQALKSELKATRIDIAKLPTANRHGFGLRTNTVCRRSIFDSVQDFMRYGYFVHNCPGNITLLIEFLMNTS